MPIEQDILSIGFDYKKTQADAEKVLAQMQRIVDAGNNVTKSFSLIDVSAGFAASKKGAQEVAQAVTTVKKSYDEYGKTLTQTGITQKQKIAMDKAERNEMLAIQKELDKLTAKREKEAAAKKASADIPFTTNLNADGSVIEPAANSTGTAVNDLDREQAEAAISATAWGNANRKAAEGVNVAKKSAEQLRIEEERDLKIKVEDKLLASQRAAQLKNEVREQNAVKGSLEQRRAALIRLNAVYDNQSPVERASASGQRLQKITAGLTNQVKELEKGTGRAQRNVGNYAGDVDKGTTATQKFTAAAGKAYSGLKILANIIPGLGISGIFLLGGQAIASTIDYIKEAIGQVVDFAERMKVLGQVNLKAIESFGAQRSQVEGLTAVIKDGNASLDDKKRALTDLIALDPKFLQGLTLANIATDEGKKILDDYVNLLRRKAELEAAGAIQADASKEVYKLEVIKDLLRKRLVAVKTNYDDLSEEELKFLNKMKTSTGRINFTASVLNLEVPKSDIQEMLVGVEDELKKANKRVTASLDVFKSKFKAVGSEDVKLGVVESLKKEIDELDKQINFETLEKKIPGLVSARKKLQDQLDDLLGKEDKGKKIKTISDYLKELRKELSSIDKQQVTGLLGDTDADLERVKAYKKTLDEIFKIGANENSPVVKQILFELNPVNTRLLEDSIKAFEDKLKPPKLSFKQAYKELLEGAPEALNKFRDEQTKAYEDDLSFRQTVAAKDFATSQTKLLAFFALGKISEKEYQEQLLDIQETYAEKSIQAQIDSYESELKYAFIGVANTQENADKRLEIEKKLAEARLALGVKIKAADDKDQAKRRENLIKFLGEFQDRFNQVADILGGVINIGVTKEKNALQEVEDERQKNYDNELERINGSTLSETEKADKIKILEAQRQAQKAEFDRKNREADLKKAKFDKAQAIMNIIINTAAAVVKALPAIPLAILAGVLGAAQLAVAIATPLPRYAKGLKSAATGHVGVYGEDGPEIVDMPGQKPFIADSETVAFIPRGTNITPIGKDEINQAMYRSMAKRTAEAMGANRNQPDKLEGLVEQLITVTKKGNQKGVIVKNYIKDSREWSIYTRNYYK
jgi:hypothetical protein